MSNAPPNSPAQPPPNWPPCDCGCAGDPFLKAHIAVINAETKIIEESRERLSKAMDAFRDDYLTSATFVLPDDEVDKYFTTHRMAYQLLEFAGWTLQVNAVSGLVRMVKEAEIKGDVERKEAEEKKAEEKGKCKVEEKNKNLYVPVRIITEEEKATAFAATGVPF